MKRCRGLPKPHLEERDGRTVVIGLRWPCGAVSDLDADECPVHGQAHKHVPRADPMAMLRRASSFLIA